MVKVWEEWWATTTERGDAHLSPCQTRVILRFQSELFTEQRLECERILETLLSPKC